MKINDLYGAYESTAISDNLKTEDATGSASFRKGDILEGIVTEVGKSTRVSFEKMNNREISFDSSSVKDAYVGEKRRFEVVEASAQKLVLKDMGSIGSEAKSRAIMGTDVASGNLSGLVEGFSETMEAEEEDDSSVGRMSDEDYSELRREGFSIEDFKAERLVRAIDRIKTNRRNMRESIETQAKDLKEERKSLKRQAVKSAAEKYSASQAVIEKLVNADLPITEENVACVMNAVSMSDSTARMTDNSMAYMMKNGLKPTVGNIYKSIYSGSIKQTVISDTDWAQLEKPATELVEEANKDIDAMAGRQTDKAVAGGQAAGGPADKAVAGGQAAGGPADKAVMGRQATGGSADKAVVGRQAADVATDKPETDSRASVRDISPKPERAVLEDARWMIERDIPLSRANLVLKKQLEELRMNGRSPEFVAEAAAEAISEGKQAEDAVLVSNPEEVLNLSAQPKERTFKELTARYNLQQIRLSMAVSSGTIPRVNGLEIDIDRIRTELAELKNELRDFWSEVAKEIGSEQSQSTTDGAPEQTVNRAGNLAGQAAGQAEYTGRAENGFIPGITEDDIELAIETADAAYNVSSSPLTLYGRTFTARFDITLRELSSEAVRLKLAAGRYEESGTEIRSDLGDSIRKAFGSVDELILNAGLELSEANRRAVRILGYNSMEITEQNINSIKHYDARVTAMIDGMKPAVVMSMIKRGFNPLDSDVDSINDEIERIIAEEGYTAEEKFSTFLVRMDEADTISAEARAAYVGIYRLLYQIGKDDGAAVGAAVRSGRKLTLENLLTESRTRTGAGIDADIYDTSKYGAGTYSNSITEQIRSGFVFTAADETVRYTVETAKKAAEVVLPKAWEEALGENPERSEYGQMSVEQLKEKLEAADKKYSDGAAASEVRAVMALSSPTKAFLRNLGVKDSVRNIRAMSGIFENSEDGPALGVSSKAELTDAMTSEDSLQRLFDDAEKEAVRSAEGELLSGIAILTRGADIGDGIGMTLDRFGILKDMSRQEHYRFRLEEEGTPARINLTVIHSEDRAGTVSLEISTSSYHVWADMSLDIYDSDASALRGSAGRIEGRISCDASGEDAELQSRIEEFKLLMQESGYDTEGLASVNATLPANLYLGRLGELRHRAGGAVAKPKKERTKKTDTVRLYAIAKEFVAKLC